MSKTFSVSAIVAMMVSLSAPLAMADEAPASPAAQDLKTEIKQERVQIKADKEKLKEDVQAKGKDSPEAKADKTQLRSDIKKVRALRKQRHEAKVQAEGSAPVATATSNQ